MTSQEFNLDGIVGPTHNYAGLSFGNVASEKHQNRSSSPRQAALQGLEKMMFVAQLGIGQYVLPPLLRPNFNFLRNIGFYGTDGEIIDQVHRQNPLLLATVYSASNMWTANAATVSPSADAIDRKLHLSTANLTSKLHRSIEAASTHRLLQFLFADPTHFTVHDPLPGTAAMSDEGAANHTRITDYHGNPGFELFVYGSQCLNRQRIMPTKYPSRQTLESAKAIARRHQLKPDESLFFQQNPEAIDAGVFHNDVICVGNEDVLLCHEKAFLEQPQKLAELQALFQHRYDRPMHIIEFKEQEIKLPTAVSTYLFNSQLLTRPDGKMTLLSPQEVETNQESFACTQRLLESANPVDQVVFMDLRESMKNGGGPACLRLRVVMNESEQNAIHPGCRLTPHLYQQLKEWIQTHYRESLSADDLRDPYLIEETRNTLQKLCGILDLPQEVLMIQD